jgi:long-chain-fatty-acid--[acyl-carrier-protein] ligase
VFQKVKKIILEETELKNEQILLEANINLDLNIDSINLVTIISRIEDHFSVISQKEITDIKVVRDLCSIAIGVGESVEKLKPSALSTHIAPFVKVSVDKNKPIPALFLEVFSKFPAESFTYDKMLGSTSRKEFLLKVYVVAQLLKKEVKGKYVGIMLPALQSTNLLVMATYISGKIPVMFNWTVGKTVLEHCFDSSGAEVILTAKTFFDKVSDQLSDKVKNHCVFFEQKVKELSLATKLSGVFNKVIKSKPKVKLDDTAVILFTSGSESLPKAVHLSHRNIVADMWGVFENININTDKIFLSFLPPFHSFGFTVLTILPSITGVKVAYTPDPTDSREVVKILKHTKANTILGTPTFLKMLLSVAVHKDFSNVELAISGAESLHPDVMKNFYEKASPEARLLEGYGITECAPVLTINPLEKQKEKSVGTFIKGLEYLITNINDYTPLEQGKEGMIMVRGENVFSGYKDKEISSPFVNIDGKEYYKTGDLGYVDEEGYLFITGRLKRFIKVAGEMISLPAIESTLLKKYGSSESVTIAVEGNDVIQPPQTVLFSTFEADLNEVNSYLKESGFSSLVKINKIVQVQEIPLLGTGKTDYKVLKEMIN